MSRAKDGKPVTREFDQTQLKMASFKFQPHKDYLGHIFRWGFASRYVNNTLKVLDVGCGQEMPFARSLGGANPTSVPKEYVGVDLNAIKNPVSRKNFTVYDNFNFVTNYRQLIKKHGKFDVIVNFEVYEHMQPELGAKLLRNMKRCLSENGVLIFSTPVYSPRFKMAKNHINEVTKSEMEDSLHKAGLKIIKQYGTFANWNDLKKVMTKDEIALQTHLATFYSNDVLGCFMSPKYPEAARNITHICALHGEECELKESNIQ